MNPASARMMQIINGGWKNPKTEFGNAPPGCKEGNP